MTQFDILVKSSIPPCQILARTAPEFTECNSKSASTRAFFFFFYITNWTLGWLRMLQNGFFLNQKKNFSEIQHCTSAEQIVAGFCADRQAGTKTVGLPGFSQKH